MLTFEVTPNQFAPQVKSVARELLFIPLSRSLRFEYPFVSKIAMKIFVSRILAVVAFSTICAAALTQTVTLVPPLDHATRKYDAGKSCFNFKLGQLKETALKETRSNDWHLGYGFLAIGDEDWFILHSSTRSVIEDLSDRNWDNLGTIPVLEPLPPFPKDKPRQIVIDSSGDTHKTWAKATKIFAKAALGHMYVLHVKDDADDFYALFRVEELEQNKRCTISWRRIPSPEPPEAR